MDVAWFLNRRLGLEGLSTTDAAKFCRNTIRAAAQERSENHPETTDRLHFCITINSNGTLQRDADALTHMLAGYMVRYAQPDAAEKDPEAYRQAMADLFRKAHFQE